MRQGYRDVYAKIMIKVLLVIGKNVNKVNIELQRIITVNISINSKGIFESIRNNDIDVYIKMFMIKLPSEKHSLLIVFIVFLCQ